MFHDFSTCFAAEQPGRLHVRMGSFSGQIEEIEDRRHHVGNDHQRLGAGLACGGKGHRDCDFIWVPKIGVPGYLKMDGL